MNHELSLSSRFLQLTSDIARDQTNLLQTRYSPSYLTGPE